MTRRSSESTLARRINTIHGVLFPGETRGAMAWFLRELHARGTQVSASTLHRWTTQGIPDDRVTQVHETLEELAAVAQQRVDQLQKKLKEAR